MITSIVHHLTMPPPVTVVNRLLRQLSHSYGNECSIVMERSSQQLWNDRPNCDPCGLTCSITIYADYLSFYS